MDFNEFPEYDIIWCDPPWEQKMVSYFETLMFKNGYKKPHNTIEKIIGQLALLANKHKPVFIEYSIKGFELIVDIMTKQGHSFCNNVYSLQENGNPYFILVFNCEHYSPNGSKQGFNIIDSLCKEFAFNIVFDPFAGIGKIANRFLKNGKNYIGSEINPLRFNKLQKVWQER